MRPLPFLERFETKEWRSVTSRRDGYLTKTAA